MEYLKKLNEKDPTLGGPSRHDTCVKEMYSCGHACKGASVASNVTGVTLTVVLLCFIVYRFINRPVSGGINRIVSFANEQEVTKVFIGLLLLSNIKTLSNSLIANIILPLIKPVLPLISCNLKIKVGLFDINVGEFVSDLLVFGINLYIIYILFQIVY
jgi:hypothetical protein